MPDRLYNKGNLGGTFMSRRALPSLLAVFAAVSLAQDRGTITGTVTDAAGASVPGATLKATNPATGLTQTTSSSADGTFSIPYLPPGGYVVTGEKAGFRTAEVTGIVVNVSTTVKVDLKLEVGQITERVEVTAAAPPVVSERSDLGAVVTTKIASLGNDRRSCGRDFHSFCYLTYLE